jgi:hypothetical protein
LTRTIGEWGPGNLTSWVNLYFILAQLSQLAEDFVFFRRFTTREGSSIQECGSKSACREDLLSSRGKFFNYNVVL